VFSIVKSILLTSTRHPGFGLVAVFGVIGVVASLVLVQQGVDLSSATIV